jgi:hypothetical protein
MGWQNDQKWWNDEYERIWKEAVMAYLMVPARNSHGKTKEKYGNSY